jgi:CheY-like chemotaxis protein
MEKKIMLIDDNKATNFINKTVIKKTLSVNIVFEATNGEEALMILKEGWCPEIIFLDLNMPVMNGWEFLAEFQELGLHSKIVVMIGEELTESEYVILKSKFSIDTFNKKILDKESLYKMMDLRSAV